MADPSSSQRRKSTLFPGPLRRAANVLDTFQSNGNGKASSSSSLTDSQRKAQHRRTWSHNNFTASIRKSLDGVLGLKMPRAFGPLSRSRTSLSESVHTSTEASPADQLKRASSERLPSASARRQFSPAMAKTHESVQENQSGEEHHDSPSPASTSPHEQSAIPPNTHLTEQTTPSPTEEVKVPALLLRGTPLVKLSEKKTGTRLFRVDPDQGQILWPSKKRGVINLESIKEIRTGDDIRQYSHLFKIAPNVERRWMTIVYLADLKYKTLHVIAPSVDVFRMWVDTVRKLWDLRQELMSAGGGRIAGLAGVQRREQAWERLYWKGADASGEEQLDWQEVKRLCLRLNIHAPEEDLLGKFKAADVLHRGYLDFKDFQRFVKLLKARPDIKRLWNIIRAGGEVNFEKFKRFMKDVQKSTLSDEELSTIFHRFALIPPQSPALPSKKELPDVSPVTPSSTPPGASTLHPSSTPQSLGQSQSSQSPISLTPSETTLSLAGFTAFLLSAENAPFKDSSQDMTRPLSEYYISSSHNTYLVGHQLVGVSTTEGYIRALMQGCRSVELDIYDGEHDEPQIFHGKTLTSKVSLREVCTVIAKYAFVASPYPVIISAEVHCCLTQQDMVAVIMKETFGDALVQHGVIVEGLAHGHDKELLKLEVLPSPEALKGRVLLKAKNQNLIAPEGGGGNEHPNEKDIDSDTTMDEWDMAVAKSELVLKAEAKQLKADFEGGLSRAKKMLNRVRRRSYTPSQPSPTADARPKIRMSEALEALLVYTVGVKCRGINKKQQYAVEHVFSLSEKTANKVMKQGMMDLVKHNKTHVVRIYPKGLRLNSSNYEPHRYWAAGAQLVAINWQTFDLGYMINHAMFQRNNRLGFVLKPEALRLADKAQLSTRTDHFLDVTIISAQQLPRAKDAEGREILDRHIVDPFVEVSLLIPDWMHSPFLNEEDKESSTTSTAPSGPNAALSSRPHIISRRTSVVKNNGFNPVWEEKLSIPFDCVGRMHEMIFVKVEVKEDDGEDHAPIALYCTSLGCLQPGYRHLPLHDQQLSQYLFSTLFVRTEIRDVQTTNK